MYKYNSYEKAKEFISNSTYEELDKLFDEIKLTNRMKEMLLRRFSLYYGRKYTQKEVGAIFNISKSRVNQIEHIGLSKLYKRIETGDC